VALAFASIGAACLDRDGHSPLPPAEVYAVPSNFAGEWMGQAGLSNGLLRISELGEGRYRGIYRAEDQPVQLVLAMEQATAEVGNGPPRASNLVAFTWQDGRGGRGRGWLLINREDSALIGAFGRGEDTSNNGEWTFIRLE
jgi:hypothetical protein